MQLTQEVVYRLISSKILTRRVSVKLSGVGLGKSASRLRRPDADIRRDVLNAWPEGQASIALPATEVRPRVYAWPPLEPPRCLPPP